MNWISPDVNGTGGGACKTLQHTLIALKSKLLRDTLEHINIDQRLAGVLGYSLVTDETRVPPSRKRLHYGDSPDAVIPTPVKELVLNKLMPQVTNKEKSNSPTVQKQSKISFVSDESVEIFVAGEED